MRLASSRRASASVRRGPRRGRRPRISAAAAMRACAPDVSSIARSTRASSRVVCTEYHGSACVSFGASASALARSARADASSPRRRACRADAAKARALIRCSPSAPSSTRARAWATSLSASASSPRAAASSDRSTRARIRVSVAPALSAVSAASARVSSARSSPRSSWATPSIRSAVGRHSLDAPRSAPRSGIGHHLFDAVAAHRRANHGDPWLERPAPVGQASPRQRRARLPPSHRVAAAGRPRSKCTQDPRTATVGWCSIRSASSNQSSQASTVAARPAEHIGSASLPTSRARRSLSPAARA